MSALTRVHVQPGDLLLTRSSGWASAMIRFGAAARDEPNLINHVAVVHHTDDAGNLWCAEGRPGGVGWAAATPYLASPWTVTNAGQPKTPAQRDTIAAGALALLGTGYDWEAIAADALDALHLRMPTWWRPEWGGAVPGHVVCSSLAAWLYQKAGLTCPPGDRKVTPADWQQLIIRNRWE